MSDYLNDGSSRAPRFKPFLNMGNLNELPAWSSWPEPEGAEVYAVIKAAGFEGVQGGDPEQARAAGLDFAGGGRINTPKDVGEYVKRWQDSGAIAATVHVLWGLEDDDVVDATVDSILDNSAASGMPIYIETHRSTITDDMWRTVKLIERRPALRINGDLSHWYTGHEMVYGGIETKLSFIQPVFERVRFVHGRIGNPGCMQVDIGADLAEATARPYVGHFMQMWTAIARVLIAEGKPGDYIPFAPELLHPSIFYAQRYPDASGELREVGDRWQQARLYVEIADRCLADA